MDLLSKAPPHTKLCHKDPRVRSVCVRVLGKLISIPGPLQNGIISGEHYAEVGARSDYENNRSILSLDVPSDAMKCKLDTWMVSLHSSFFPTTAVLIGKTILLSTLQLLF